MSVIIGKQPATKKIVNNFQLSWRALSLTMQYPVPANID